QPRSRRGSRRFLRAQDRTTTPARRSGHHTFSLGRRARQSIQSSRNGNEMQPASASLPRGKRFFFKHQNACVDSGCLRLTLERGDQPYPLQRLISMSMKPFLLSSAASLALLFSGVSHGADPASEMAEFSVFGKIDPAALANGEVKTAAGSPMSSERYLSVQSCFVIPQPPAKGIAAMKSFNPSAHRELKVILHSALPVSPT